MISFRSVEFSYPHSSQLFKFKDFKFDGQQHYLITGVSGSGKSTLLSLIAGFLTPQMGDILIDNNNISKISECKKDKIRSHYISFIFQTHELIPFLSSAENITLPHMLAGKDIDNKYFMTLTEQLAIHNILDKPVHKLSLGQKQRIAIARAMISKPKILLADEPTSSLDQEMKHEFLSLLKRLAQSSTIICVSHDLSIQNNFDQTISFTDVLQ